MLHIEVEGKCILAKLETVWHEEIVKSDAFMLERAASLNHKMKPKLGNWHNVNWYHISRYKCR